MVWWVSYSGVNGVFWDRYYSNKDYAEYARLKGEVMFTFFVPFFQLWVLIGLGMYQVFVNEVKKYPFLVYGVLWIVVC